MKTFNTLVLASAASLALSACGAVNDALDSIKPPSGRNGHYRVISTPDLSSADTSNVRLKINGKVYRSGDPIDIALLHQNQVHNQSYELTADKMENRRKVNFKEEGTARIYKNKYSVVLAAHVEKEIKDRTSSTVDKSKVLAVQGIATELNAVITKKGVFGYEGQAFTGKNDQGELIYQVDFDKGTGIGYVKNFKTLDTVNLQESKITGFNPDGSFNAKVGIEGKAGYKGKEAGSYKLGFFGPSAEEIAGKAELKIDGKDTNIGFGGRKVPKLRIK
ncbi:MULTISPECIES: factor H binding protein domain-containing protein [unclassified Neisseria]|uniref:factor H binding protein domain-containing protein n=1 Tax=unclassified Neisseria TaxID=2623750 RepID=UPI002666086A|nr:MULTISPECIES: factor H binding protein domain-containing protein [unclassified Neisseria]MDO1509736.1 factor H binding family protein [Neisseria sp. MVDL19-042950]MDO1515940.1 factor H binding family protein [Neisseria sp. MVDL18-041461]MDO1563053.1 factor H binding family protein [Neisseria sp. MVDL20-010259]